MTRRAAAASENPAAEPEPRQAAGWIGRRLGGTYELRRLLGVGGMAWVFEAVHVRLRRPVAVKVLLPDFAFVPGFVERFVFEARTAAGVAHPNVIDVLDLGVDEGVHYMVMELLQGETLSSRIERTGALPARAALPIALQVLDALAAAHDVGILHRDLKPDNVYLSRRHDATEVVKLLDFGIARSSAVSDGRTRITEQGLVVGTPAYMSPEQAAGHDIDGRSDLYSFGVLLYETLSGRLPHGGDDPDVLRRIVQDDPRPLADLVPGLRRGLSAVISRTLSRSPDHRYPDARALKAALRRAHEGAGHSTAPPARSPRRRPAKTRKTVAQRPPRR